MPQFTEREITPDEAGIRLDRWLRRHHPGLTQGSIEKLCRTGQIRLDGARTEAAARLQPGQQIRIPPLPAGRAPAPRAEPSPRDAAELRAMIVYQDDAVVALNKPPGLSVQGGPGIIRHIDAMLETLRHNDERPHLVHRIDRDTSGLLLLARTPGAAAKLAAMFRERRVEKTYWAITVGRPEMPRARIALPLARTQTGTHLSLADPEPGTEAITDYETLDATGQHFALLGMHPRTGRTHQLRVHAAALGTPILGDPKYGGERAQVDGYPKQLHLHARALALPHPNGGELALQAEPPPHFRETLARLGLSAR